MVKEKIVLAWSGGKDSAMSLYRLRQDDRYEVIALMTNFNEFYDRVMMHGVRRSLMEQQADSIGIPLDLIRFPARVSNSDYAEKIGAALANYRQQGVRTIAHGDLFLQDIRQYREKQLATVNMNGIFPVWGRDTAELAREFIRLGFKAALVCVDTQQLDASFAGRLFDDALLRDLPEGVDPCGENGEFHTFVFAGPIFKFPLDVTIGETVLRENRFCFCDVK
jgi:uncharacterized protein (TIGR00290 family)